MFRFKATPDCQEGPAADWYQVEEDAAKSNTNV